MPNNLISEININAAASIRNALDTINKCLPDLLPETEVELFITFGSNNISVVDFTKILDKYPQLREDISNIRLEVTLHKHVTVDF